MATQQLLQAPPIVPFDIDDANNVGTRWERWTKRFEVYIVATGLKKTTHKNVHYFYFVLETLYKNYLITYRIPQKQKTTKPP